MFEGYYYFGNLVVVVDIAGKNLVVDSFDIVEIQGNFADIDHFEFVEGKLAGTERSQV